MRPHLEPVSGPEPLEWLAAHLSWHWMGSRPTVASFVPDTFEACARILHPAWTRDEGLVPWAEVAAWSGRELEPTSSFEDLATRPDGQTWSDAGREDPLEEMSQEAMGRLASILARFTTTPDLSWSCVWSGYGATELHQPELEITPELSASGRKYYAFRGPVEVITSLEFPAATTIFLEAGPDRHVEVRPMGFHGPSFWWPEDRAWFYADEIDGPSTYLGGSTPLIEELLADPVLEVVPASPGDPFEGILHEPEVP